MHGVAYNPGHDWRDGGRVLTRRQLENDFSAIKAMGGNTIRRYSGGWHDYNLFNVAAEKDVKVLYGLWLDQDVDYAHDLKQLAEFERDYLAVVRRYKDEPALLGWVIGNEVWGMFKHSYEQPYLTDVRHAYVRFVERLARQIKEIDPNHPVMVACEFSDEIAGALSDYAALAPSVDVIGVNVYYEPHLARLPKLMSEQAPNKPYLVTEFGPDGYWHHELTQRTDEGRLIEAAAHEKAQQYASRWAQRIESQRGHKQCQILTHFQSL